MTILPFCVCLPFFICYFPLYLLLLGPKETHSPIRIISNFLLKPTYFASHSGCWYYVTLCNSKSLRFNRERDHLEEAFVLCEVLSCPSEQQKMEERRPTTTKKLLQRNTKSYFFCYKNSQHVIALVTLKPKRLAVSDSQFKSSPSSVFKFVTL